MAGKVYVVYASVSGNTRKVAQEIAKATGGVLVNVRREALPKVEPADIIFLGDGVYFGRPSRAMRRALRGWTLPKGVRAVVFGTYGVKPAQVGILEKILREKGAEVKKSFSCPGRDWLFLGFIARGRPNAADLKAAAEFAKKVVAGRHPRA